MFEKKSKCTRDIFFYSILLIDIGRCGMENLIIKFYFYLKLRVLPVHIYDISCVDTLMHHNVSRELTI